MTQAKVAIVGVGNVGAALGERLARAGFSVRFGVKAGADVAALLDRCGPNASAGPVAEAAAGADLVFLAVPPAALGDVVAQGRGFEGKIVVDCNNPVGWSDGPTLAPVEEGSLTAKLVKLAPKARVVKGFNTFGAEFHRDPALAGGQRADVPLAGDDAGAKEAVADLARRAGFEPVDAGPLRNAALLESLAILWIHLAVVGGQGREFTFQLARRG
ncbi:MAG TPA: NAD(P)-binding domain-containing protein [Polyangiaceae bacterium]|nr:NAD(P)-binding domain-containing protein [Polyangiaceae bacterium]